MNGKPLTAFGMIAADWSGDVNALADRINEHTEDTNNPHETTPENIGSVDYITARGTEGDWVWEKWESGKAVCWAQSNFGNIPVTNGWGSIYESNSLNKDFPSGLFVDIPKYLHINVVSAGGAAFVAQFNQDITKENTGIFALSRPTSLTVTNVKLGFYAIGRWK
jgi:hypothetical protein